MFAECQVCGKPAAGEGTVEGTKVPLCERDSAYSSNFAYSKEFEDFIRDKDKAKAKPSYSAPPGMQKPAVRVQASGEGELAEDYGKKIMQARSKLGMSRKDLAHKLMIQEKELEGFEQHKYKPSEAIVKKLEFALGISLMETSE